MTPEQKRELLSPELKAAEKEFDDAVSEALLKYADAMKKHDISGSAGAAGLLNVLLSRAYEIATFGNKSHADIMRVFNLVFDRMGKIRERHEALVAEAIANVIKDVVKDAELDAACEHLKGSKPNALDIN